MMMSPKCILLLLVTFEVYVSALAGPSKMSDSHSPNIVSIMKTLQKKGHMRSRRSYHDNRVDTFPAQPVYFNERSHDISQFPDRGDSYHPPYDLEGPHDAGLDMLSSFDFQEAQSKGEHPTSAVHHPHHREPLDFASLLLGDDVLTDDSDLAFPPLPAKFDFKAPVSERAEKEADTIMADFLNFLDLRASGALDECLKGNK